MIILDLSYLQRNQAVSQTEEKDFYMGLEIMALPALTRSVQDLQVTMSTNKYILKTLGSYSTSQSNPFGHIEYNPYPDTYVPYLCLLFHS